MNLKHRLGELFIIGFQGSEIKPGSQLENILETGRPGGVILFNRCLSNPETGGNITSPQQLKNLTTKLHSLSSMPLFVCVDQEGGGVQRLNSGNGFFDICSAEEMGSICRQDLVRQEAERTAKLLHDSGINLNFAPVVDLNIHDNNPIIGGIKRSFSPEPDRVIKCAETWIDCHRQFNVISCPKHFPGHGSSTADSHLGFVDISDSWHESELLPFQHLISTNRAEMIMVGHLFNRNIDHRFPATLSHLTVTGILRNTLEFQGVIVTDDMQMKAISNHFTFAEAICHSLSAGIDMIIIGNNLEHRPELLQEAIEAVWSGLKKGSVREETVIASLERIRRLKLSIKE